MTDIALTMYSSAFKTVYEEKSQEEIPPQSTESLWSYRKLFNYTYPRARKAVFVREAMKSAVVKCIDEIRKALLTIGAKMHEEERLPRKELIFFLTLDEMHRLTNQHDSNLVSKCVFWSKVLMWKFPIRHFYSTPNADHALRCNSLDSFSQSSATRKIASEA